MIKYIIPVLTGAIIGYFTNYIAIKMLFRPRKEIKIFGIKLPFTPGIIPKNQPRIAKAVGNAVETKLFTGDDLKSALLSDKMQTTVSDAVINYLCNDELTVSSLLSEDTTEKIYALIYEKISNGIKKLDISQIITEVGTSAIKQKLKGSMLSMFINDGLIKSLAEPLSQSIGEYIDEKGEELILPLVKSEGNELGSKNIKSIAEKMGYNEPKLSETIKALYIKAVNNNYQKIISSVNISNTVEDKINQMNTIEVEELIMSIMKNELQAIINLGALIGAIIGTVNIFF